MARPHKQTVDYFPHYSNASNSKTLYILESKFGNDGYAFWFKLLELLANSKSHVYDVRNPIAWEFLLAKTHIHDDIANKIMDLLVNLDAIDKDLWLQKIIWIQNLVDNIADAYRNRKTDIPLKPGLNGQKPSTTGINDVNNEVSDTINPHIKLKDIILNNTIEEDDTIITNKKELFNTYKKKLIEKYPGLDIEEEWERCQIWYRDHKKEMKSPSLALGNWCKKETEIKKNGQSKAGSDRELPDTKTLKEEWER